MTQRLKLLLAVFILVLLGGMAAMLWGDGLAHYTGSEDGASTGHPHAPRKTPAPLSRRWLQAVRRGEKARAVKLAAQLVPSAPSPPESDYVKLATRQGIHRLFLTDSFNEWDYYRWRSALFFRQLSEKIVRGEDRPIEALFRAVVKRLEPRRVKDGAPLWPMRIWQQRAGLCDRQAWVLCELAYQQGWNAQIVYLRDPETGVSHHTIAELRKGNTVYTADPFKDVLLKGRSVRDLADQPESIRRYWPESKKLWSEFANAIYWTPAYPQDYCPRNQELYRVAKQELGKACPRFGRDPADRLKHYDHLRRGTASENDPMPIRLWFYPFRLLRASLQKRRRNKQPAK